MQTQLSDSLLKTQRGQEIDRILRACVHCGFCTATCPTYQLLGDELDGPRGRIYQIKHMLEGHNVSHETQLHLDRCLSCRACESTCPSGVEYGRLLDFGREQIEAKLNRPIWQRWQRQALRSLIPYPARLKPVLGIGQRLKPLLPKALKAKIPEYHRALEDWPEQSHKRQVLLLEGCAQSVMRPQTSLASARLLNRLSIQTLRLASVRCCGAMSHHLSATAEAQDMARSNIDAWWPYVEQGIEAIISSASGCGVHVKDYGHLLADDPHYAEKAKSIGQLCRDLGEIVSAEALEKQLTLVNDRPSRVAFQSPCTLQHGQKLKGVVESVLTRLGVKLPTVEDEHLCCGSAGTYSILQADLSQRLRENKLKALQKSTPELILTANIGCQLHLDSASPVEVWHWVEYLDRYCE